MSTPGESARALGFQPGGDADFCLEEFRDRTAGFGGFHGGVEFRFVRPRNTRDEVEMALGDCETVGELVERNGRSRLELACRSEEHTSELQSQSNLVCRLLLEKKKEIRERCVRCALSWQG